MMRLSHKTPSMYRAAIMPTMLFVFLLGSYLAGNSQTNLWDRDEPRYAGTAHNMLESGDFIVPYFNGTFRFTKPVLTYWLIAGCFSLFGESEFVARLPSGLAVAGACVVVYWLGNRRFGKPAGLLAAVMLGLSPMAAFLAKLCLPDGPQFFFATICFGSLWVICNHAIQTASPRSDAALDRAGFVFWLSISLAIMTKGPIVPGMAVGALALHKLIARMPWSRYRLRLPAGLTMMLLIAGPWYAAIYFAAGSAFFREAGGNQLFGRAMVSFDKMPWPPGYYAVSVAGGILPWLGFFWLAVARSRTRLLRDPDLVYLFAWTFGSMAVLEIFRSKQPHYYAPAYPAILLFVSDFLARLFRGEQTWRFDRVARGLIALAAVLACIGTLLMVLLMARVAHRLAPDCIAIAIGLGGLCLAAGWATERNRPEVGFWLTAVSVTGVLLVLSLDLLPALSARCMTRGIATHIAGQAPRELPVILHRVVEPNLTYYSNRALPSQFEAEKLLNAARRSTGGVLSLLTETELQSFKAIAGHELSVLRTWFGMLKMHNDTVHLVHLPPRIVDAAESLSGRPRQLH